MSRNPSPQTSLLWEGMSLNIMQTFSNHTLDGEVRWEFVTKRSIAVVVPVLPSLELVLALQHRVAIGDQTLEFPAGHIEAGEAPVQTAFRELKEEVGYIAGSMTPLCTVYTAPHYSNEKAYIFSATELTRTLPHNEPDENIQPQIMTAAAVRTKCLNGQIVDAKTIVAYFAYEQANR